MQSLIYTVQSGRTYDAETNNYPNNGIVYPNKEPVQQQSMWALGSTRECIGNIMWEWDVMNMSEFQPELI